MDQQTDRQTYNQNFRTAQSSKFFTSNYAFLNLKFAFGKTTRKTDKPIESKEVGTQNYENLFKKYFQEKSFFG